MNERINEIERVALPDEAIDTKRWLIARQTHEDAVRAAARRDMEDRGGQSRSAADGEIAKLKAQIVALHTAMDRMSEELAELVDAAKAAERLIMERVLVLPGSGRLASQLRRAIERAEA